MAIPIPKFSGITSKLLSLLPKQKFSQGQGQRRVGLNIGRSSIVACEMSTEGDQVTLEACARRNLDKEKSVGGQIKELFEEAKFESKTVRVSLKGQGVVARFLTFPKMSRADFASSIQFEAEKYLPFSLSDVNVDYHILNGGAPASKEEANTMQVILVAARKTEVNKLIDACTEAGLTPDAIDIDAFAQANAFEWANPDAKEHAFGLIDFGAVDSSFAILDHGRLTFSRDVAFGGNDLTEWIRRKLNISHEAVLKIQEDPDLKDPDQLTMIEEGVNRLLQELKSSLNYYYNQHQNATPLETIYISGGFSQLSRLPQWLEKQMEIPVNRWDPTLTLMIGSGVNPEFLKSLVPYLPVSIGLAIRPK